MVELHDSQLSLGRRFGRIRLKKGIPVFFFKKIGKLMDITCMENSMVSKRAVNSPARLAIIIIINYDYVENDIERNIPSRTGLIARLFTALFDTMEHGVNLFKKLNLIPLTKDIR